MATSAHNIYFDVDIQSLSRHLSTLPWETSLESFNKVLRSVNLDAYTEALKSFATLDELYRKPYYLDSSMFIRNDVEDGEKIVDNPVSSSSTAIDNTVSVTDNTNADEINKANQEYLDYLRTRTEEISNTIARTEFEDGMDNDVTILIKGFANTNRSATYNWLDELYSKNLNKPSVVQGILRTLAMITNKGDENILLPIVIASLRNNNSAEQEAAIMVIEEWRTKECLDALNSVSAFSSEMIADYAKIVIEELKEELS